MRATSFRSQLLIIIGENILSKHFALIANPKLLTHIIHRAHVIHSAHGVHHLQIRISEHRR